MFVKCLLNIKDVYGIIKTSFCFYRKYYVYKYEEENPKLIKFKQSDEIIKVMEQYIQNYTKKARFTEEILNRELYISKENLLNPLII